MVVEFGVVIRRQFKSGETKWQLWTGAGKTKEEASFLAVMNYAGAQGFEAVAAGRKMEMAEPAAVAVQAPLLAPVKAVAAPAEKATVAKPAAKAPAKKKASAAKV